VDAANVDVGNRAYASEIELSVKRTSLAKSGNPKFSGNKKDVVSPLSMGRLAVVAKSRVAI